MPITAKTPERGEFTIVDSAEQPLSLMDLVQWKPGPRALRKCKGKIISYKHPFAFVACTDGKQRKVRPGAALKVES